LPTQPVPQRRCHLARRQPAQPGPPRSG